MKVEIELPYDSLTELLLAQLRDQAETAYSYMMQLREKKDPKPHEMQDHRDIYELLGAIYIVEEYNTLNPIIRNKFDRDA